MRRIAETSAHVITRNGGEPPPPLPLTTSPGADDAASRARPYRPVGMRERHPRAPQRQASRRRTRLGRAVGRYANVSLHPRARITPGVVVYRLDERLIYTNASYVKARIREAIAGAPTPTRWLVFDAEGMTGVDASGLAALADTIGALAHDDIRFAFARGKSPLLDRLDAAGISALVGDQNVYPTVRSAVQGCAGVAEG